MFCIMKQHEYDELKKRRRYYPKRRECACGCGRLVYCTSRKGTGRKFALDACRQRDLRARMAAADEWNESRRLSDEQGERCEQCGAAIEAHPRGRRLRFCGGRCQKRAERARDERGGGGADDSEGPQAAAKLIGLGGECGGVAAKQGLTINRV